MARCPDAAIGFQLILFKPIGKEKTGQNNKPTNRCFQLILFKPIGKENYHSKS